MDSVLLLHVPLQLFISSFTKLLPWVTEALLVQCPVVVESQFMNCVKIDEVYFFSGRTVDSTIIISLCVLPLQNAKN